MTSSHNLDATTLRTLYPAWDEFQSVRNALDPKRTLGSPALEKLFG